MNRRSALGLFLKAGLFVTPFSQRILKAAVQNWEPQNVLIYDSADRSAMDYKRLLVLAPKDIVLWDIRTEKKQVEDFLAHYGKNTTNLVLPIIVTVPTNFDAEGEVQTWTIESLLDQDRIADACYPLRGGWWSVDGDWNPTIQKVKNHLYTSPNHTDGHFQLAWLDLLDFKELQSTHSDHHERRLKIKYVNAECPK